MQASISLAQRTGYALAQALRHDCRAEPLHANGRIRRVSDLLLTPEPSDAQIQSVVDAVADAGGLDYSRERALRLGQQADGELDRLPPSPARDALRASIAYVLDRRR